MDVELIFKIAAVGIIVAVLTQLLIRSGREEQAMLTACRTYSCVDADNNANQHSVQHNKTAFRFLI